MFKPKKSLGQNFLKSKRVLQKIIETADLSSSDFVLEIGPGKGALTEKLLETNSKVIAIEKDKRAIEFLNDKFEDQINSDDLKIISADILDFDTKELPNNYKLIANIPYYITGEILEKFLKVLLKILGVKI